MKKDLQILIVDNAIVVLERVSEIISELDCVQNVITASSFDDAVEVIQQQSPDIVLLDIYLKGKEEFALLEFIKAEYPEIKAIMLTNQSTNNYKDICKKIGSDHFIDKSSEFETIPNIISSYCM